MHITIRFLKKKITGSADGMPSGQALQDNTVERTERLAHGEWLNRRPGPYRCHAVGPARATPTAFLARRPICWASVVTGYADGPDI
jgi:hypothetical protein